MSENRNDGSFTERVEVAGHELVAKVQELVKDGSAKRVVVKDSDNKELFTIPLNVGVAAGGVLALASPVLAGLGAIAALMAKVQLEIIRVDETKQDPETPTTPVDPTA